MPSSRCSSLSSSRICAWIVTSSAVVGSSAISIDGLARERHRDHHALAHAARQLVRILVDPLRGGGNADPLEHLDRAHPRRAAVELLVQDQRLDDLLAAGDRPGFSAVIGSWKIIEISLPRIARISAFDRRNQVAAPEQDPAADDPAGRLRHELENRQRRDALAAARLADDRERLAGIDLERHAIHRADHRRVGVEIGLQVLERGAAGLAQLALPPVTPCADRARRADRRRGS